MTLSTARPVSNPAYHSQNRLNTPGVFHGFFSRRGGVSKGIYQSLNCGPGSNDTPEHVAENLRRVMQAAGSTLPAPCLLYQVHGTACLTVESPWELSSRPQADAFVSATPGVALGILTADCAPVLFSGRTETGKPVIGAAHAGWKGALGGVLENTLKAMTALGCAVETIRAAIGPCIAQSSYEVGPEFSKTFTDTDPGYERFFKAGAPGKAHFDLPGFCAFRLANAGLQNVLIEDRDTFARESEFFSYRRTTHRKEPDYGRQISLILLTNSSGID